MHLEVFVGKPGNEDLRLTVTEEDLIEWWFTEDVRKQLESPDFHYIKIPMLKMDWNNWCTYEVERLFTQQVNPGFPLQEASELLQNACSIMQEMCETGSAYVVITRDF